MTADRLAAIVVLWAGGTTMSAPPAAPVPPPVAARAPNILFAIADDWGFGHAGAYGCRWVKTPAFDRVAAGGLLFSRAYTPNAKCAPSRSCILTGRNPWQLGAACNHVCYFPPDVGVFPEALARAGYLVGGTGKGWGPGVAVTADGRKRPLTGQWFEKRQAPPPTSGISNKDYAGNLEDFLAQAADGKPWCFWYGGQEPHRPYEYGSGVRIGGKKLSDIDRVPAYWPDTEVVRNDMLDYALEVEHFDRHLGRMLDLLEKRGLLNNTIVVVTSDNGMPFPRLKGNVYDGANRLPLAIMWKAGIRAPGRKIDDYVSFIDFAPTFLEAAGVAWKDSGLASSPGRSLFDVFASEKAGRVNPARDHVLLGRERTDVGRPNDAGYPVRAIVQDDLIYSENFEPDRWPACNPETGYLDCDGGPTKTLVLNLHRQDPVSPFWAFAFGKRPRHELFDLTRDPDFLHNVADDPAYAERRSRLRERMTAELRTQEDPRMSGKGGIFDSFPTSDNAVRDFYERYMRGEKPRAGWVNPTDFEKPEGPSAEKAGPPDGKKR